MTVQDFIDNINQNKCGEYELDFIIGHRYVWHGDLSDSRWRRYQNYEIVQIFFTRSADYTPMICLEIEYV